MAVASENSPNISRPTAVTVGSQRPAGASVNARRVSSTPLTSSASYSAAAFTAKAPMTANSRPRLIPPTTPSTSTGRRSRAGMRYCRKCLWNVRSADRTMIVTPPTASASPARPTSRRPPLSSRAFR
nr:hypothetical protein [Streptomyces sp. GC420]